MGNLVEVFSDIGGRPRLAQTGFGCSLQHFAPFRGSFDLFFEPGRRAARHRSDAAIARSAVANTPAPLLRQRGQGRRK